VFRSGGNPGGLWRNNVGRCAVCGESGARVALQGIVDRQGEFTVEACRDRSRLVVGHVWMISRLVPRLAGYPQHMIDMEKFVPKPSPSCRPKSASITNSFVELFAKNAIIYSTVDFDHQAYFAGAPSLGKGG
jgi:hypothetical protein